MISTLLLDRDGVLVARRQYDYKPKHMVPMEGVVEGLRSLPDLQLFIVSNQSGVARGYYSEDDVHACNEALCSRLASEGITITECVFCPHLPEEGCRCRKPGLGMWEALRDKYELVAEECVMVGDRDSDVAFGKAFGARTVLVLSGEHVDETPTWTIHDLRELKNIFETEAA